MNAAFNAPFREGCREVSKVGQFVQKYADIRAAWRVFRVNEGILQLFIFKTELLVLIYDIG